jgi:hypothetical protein
MICFVEVTGEAVPLRIFSTDNPCIPTVPPEIEKSFADPNPRFLSLVDTDPLEAEKQFREYVYYLIHYKWCRYILKLAPDGFDEFATRFPDYCCNPRGKKAVPKCRLNPKCEDSCEHTFCVLRQYENRGRPFANYLFAVARRKISDWCFRGRRESTPDDPSDLERHPDPTVSSEPEFFSPVVEDCMAAGSNWDEGCAFRNCRTLIILRYLRDIPPRQILVMLPEYRENNCSISQLYEHIRACKDEFVACMTLRGFRGDEYFGGSVKSG